jgi:hypothetical protein
VSGWCSGGEATEGRAILFGGERGWMKKVRRPEAVCDVYSLSSGTRVEELLSESRAHRRLDMGRRVETRKVFPQGG